MVAGWTGFLLLGRLLRHFSSSFLAAAAIVLASQ